MESILELTDVSNSNSNPTIETEDHSTTLHEHELPSTSTESAKSLSICVKRREGFTSAQNPALRQRQKWLERIGGESTKNVLEGIDGTKSCQYTLTRKRSRDDKEPRRQSSSNSWFGKLFERWNVAEDVQIVVGEVMYDDVREQNSEIAGCCGRGFFSMNRWMLRYLHWSFRVSFMATVSSFAIIYWFFILMFAAFFFGYRKNSGYCFGGFDDSSTDFAQEGSFLDAFILSWSTFSVVGYGNIYPTVGGVESHPSQCSLVTFVAAFESFCGLLYTAVCGAILFSKIGRLLSFAQVIFSDNVVIRYGADEGNLANGSDSELGEHNQATFCKPQEKLNCNPTSLDVEAPPVDIGNAPVPTDSLRFSSTSNAFNPKNLTRQQSPPNMFDDDHLPCPVLEFRIVNRLAHIPGGEIMDAKVKIVASLDGVQAGDYQKCRVPKRRKRRNKSKSHSSALDRRQDSYDSSRWSMGWMKPLGVYSISNRFVGLSMRKSQSFENWIGDPAPNRVFCELKVESSEHPFFKRSWTIRHTLDDESPLLCHCARDMLKANGGFWPLELNTAEKIRESVHFDQILVNIAGTCNSDGNSVYSQHVYQWGDVYVGYRFANLLHRDARNKLRVHHHLVSHVIEQVGGGAEPLSTRPISSGCQLDDMVIL